MLGDIASDRPQEVPGSGVAHERKLLVDLLFGGFEVAKRIEVSLEAFVFGIKVEHSASVGGNRFKLLSVADDSRVAHQALNFFGADPGHPRRLKLVKGHPYAWPLRVHDPPADAGLKHNSRHSVAIPRQLPCRSGRFALNPRGALLGAPSRRDKRTSAKPHSSP